MFQDHQYKLYSRIINVNYVPGSSICVMCLAKQSFLWNVMLYINILQIYHITVGKWKSLWERKGQMVSTSTESFRRVKHQQTCSTTQPQFTVWILFNQHNRCTDPTKTLSTATATVSWVLFRGSAPASVVCKSVWYVKGVVQWHSNDHPNISPQTSHWSRPEQPDASLKAIKTTPVRLSYLIASKLRTKPISTRVRY